MTAPVLLVVEQLRREVPGGIGRYASALLDGLVALGATPGAALPEVSLLASRPPAGIPDPLERWGMPVRTSLLPGPVLTRGWDRGLVRAPGGFGVVHAVSTAAPPVRRSGRRRQVLVVTVHDTVWRRFPEATTRRGRRWHEAALRRALRHADVLLVPSPEAAGELRVAGAADRRVSVLRWGTDHLPSPDRAGADALLHRLGVHGPYLLTASTREPRKNLHRLVAGYRLARRSLPEPWPLVVVGPPGWGDAALGPDGSPGSPPPEGVVAAGLVTDEVLAALYDGARAFAYVPLAEGYGLPPLEAMTFGVPVVASTGVPSVVSHAAAPSALRVDPMDVDAIADALVAAAVDDALRATLAARGRALVAGRTWRQAARWHADLWKALA
ncbi:MAG TPA: glycosyltransferase family 1 protein [Acidimicrobiales bacterium]|nr:glycosyltransferase family 1 protein [Acidimicrobiales bacterium]